MARELTGDYRKFMDKNYLGSWDIPEDDDLVLTIKKVDVDKVKNERGTEEKLTIHFVEDYKPLIMNATNCDRIAQAYGSTKVETWPGKRVSLTTEKVAAFGGIKDAVRIRPYAPKETHAVCENCGCVIEPVTHEGKEYSVNKIVTMSKSKYGEVLCWDCAMAKKEAAE